MNKIIDVCPDCTNGMIVEKRECPRCEGTGEIEVEQTEINLRPLGIKLLGCDLYADIPKGKWTKHRVEQIQRLISQRFELDLFNPLKDNK